MFQWLVFRVDPRENKCSFWLFCACDSVCNDLVSDSDGDGDSDSGSPARRVAVILSTVATVQELQQNTQQEEQRVTVNIDGQLKVGPKHHVAARVPPTNGESWTSVFLSWTLLGTWTQEHVDKIYILHVGKTRLWCDRIIIVRTNECIRVTVSLLALDIPVNRHQALLFVHQAGGLPQRHSFS